MAFRPNYVSKSSEGRASNGKKNKVSPHGRKIAEK
jgi:hypothetical protein